MKINFTLFLLFAAAALVNAQITVTQNDFANAGDADWMTTAQSNNSIVYQYGGADTNWNFTILQLSSQTYDQFLNPLLTNPLYALNYSNVQFNPNRCNIATEGANPTSIPLVTITGVYNFFYKNSTSYVQKGIGESINGIPTNVLYTSPDTLYQFPLQYGASFSSVSGYSLNISGLGFYGYSQTRSNTVDGWGLVATPYGTFPALRMVSTISSQDSLYIDTFHFGFKLPLPDQRLYEWIANGEQEPVLTISTTVITGNVELVNSIVYRDSLHPPVTAITQPAASPATGFVAYPNPARNDLYLRLNDETAHGAYTVYDMAGNEITAGAIEEPTQHLSTAAWARGIYLVTVTTTSETSMRKIVVE